MTFVSYDINAGKPQLLNPMRFMEHEFKDCIYQTIKKYISTDETIFYNTKRVKKLLEQLNMHKPNLTEQEYKELYLAICYQDVKYNFVDESFTKDECVNILKKDWGKVLSESELTQISNLILSTECAANLVGKKLETELQPIKFADLLHDFNMTTFLDLNKMKEDEVKLRHESELSAIEYYEQRLKYLKRLSKTDVFISDFYKQYNDLAHTNINLYIDEIKKLIQTSIYAIQAKRNI